jgi:hypothetical protein
MCGNEEKQISWKKSSRCAFDADVPPAVGRSNVQNKIQRVNLYKKKIQLMDKTRCNNSTKVYSLDEDIIDFSCS